LTPESGIRDGVENPDPGSRAGMNIPDHISESLETIFWVKKNENSLMWIRIRDGKKFGTGEKTSRIRDTETRTKKG
jgi:hypothetical protein